MSDSNTIVGASLQIDASGTQAASKSIREMKDDVQALKKAFEDTKAGTLESTEAYKKLQVAQDQLKKSTADTAKAAESGSSSFGKLREGIASVPGPLNAVGEGGNKVNTIFKTLAANPLLLVLTAIVAVLTLLYKAFTNTFEGAEKVEQIFSGIKAAAQALFDNIGHLASALVKFFTFDFSGAVDEIKAVGNAAVDAYSKMSNLTKQAQELHKEQLQNDLDQAQRQKQLALLRSQSQDEDIPVAKRKAALKELLAASEQNAKEDIDLAKRTTENKIAQLTLEKDGEKKNQDEINKLRIDQINVETENANEIRAIRRSLTQAQKQELAEQKAAADKARDEAKKRREEMLEFTNKLLKLQQDNELAAITDTYEKEKKQIDNRIADEKRANDVSFRDKKINADQLAQLNAELDKSQNLQIDALRTKHNQEVADKEAAFQKDLGAIRGKASVDALTDQRQAERVQLDITYQQQLADAAKNYKDNADHLQQIRLALAEQHHAEQQKLEEKFRVEDAKKALELKLQKDKEIIKDQKSSLEIRQKAIDDEQAQIQAAFDGKILTEQEYNAKLADLSQERMQIDQIEADNKKRIFDIISQGLGTLADAIGRQTAVGKVAAIAQTTIDTYSAAWTIFAQASKNPATIPFPAYPYIQAGLAITAGILNVKKILAVQTPGGGGGSAPSGGISAAPAAPITPAQVSTTFAGAQNPSATTTSSNRIYVLDRDIRNATERNEQLNRAARLGGG